MKNWLTLVAAAAALAPCAVGAQTITQIQPKLPTSPLELPDLVVQNIAFEGGAFTGGRCNRVAVTVGNVGNRNHTGPVVVRLSQSVQAFESPGHHVDQTYSGGIAAGASAIVRFDRYELSTDPSKAVVLISALVDPLNAVIEHGNQTNNSRSLDPATLGSQVGACPVISVASQPATEGGSVKFTLTSSRAFPRDVSVDVATSAGTATEGATCLSGFDYARVARTVTFAAERAGTLPTLDRTATVRTQEVLVPTCGDVAAERSESFDLVLQNPINASVPTTRISGRIDDRPPQ